MRFYEKQVAKKTLNSLKVTVLLIYAFLNLASTKSCYSPNWRVRNMFGEYEFEVTRHFGEYEIFLMSNPDIDRLFFIQLLLAYTEWSRFDIFV